MNNRELEMKDISELICAYFDVKEEDIFIKNKKREVLIIRQVIQYFSCKYTKLSLSKIGNYLDCGFNHATIIHSKNLIKDLCFTDEKIREHIQYLDFKIKCLYTSKSNKDIEDDIIKLINKLKKVITRGELNELLFENIKL